MLVAFSDTMTEAEEFVCVCVGGGGGGVKLKQTNIFACVTADVRMHLTLDDKTHLLGAFTKVMATYAEHCDLLVYTTTSLAILLKGGT